MRQSNLQLQNEAALMSCRIRAVERIKCAAGLAGAHPDLQDRILLSYTRIENAHEVRKKAFIFLCSLARFFLCSLARFDLANRGGWCTQENVRFFVICGSPANFVFLLPC